MIFDVFIQAIYIQFAQFVFFIIGKRFIIVCLPVDIFVFITLFRTCRPLILFIVVEHDVQRKSILS